MINREYPNHIGNLNGPLTTEAVPLKECIYRRVDKTGDYEDNGGGEGQGSVFDLERAMPSITKPRLHGENLAAPHPGWWRPTSSGHLCTN